MSESVSVLYIVSFVFFFFFNFYLFMAVLGLHFCARAFLVVASGGHSSSRCAGLSLSRPLLLRSTGSRRAGSVIMAHGPSRSAACGIFPDQGSNLCPLHWQADSQPLCHQGSPICIIFRFQIAVISFSICCPLTCFTKHNILFNITLLWTAGPSFSWSRERGGWLASLLPPQSPPSPAQWGWCRAGRKG